MARCCVRIGGSIDRIPPLYLLDLCATDRVGGEKVESLDDYEWRQRSSQDEDQVGHQMIILSLQEPFCIVKMIFETRAKYESLNESSENKQAREIVHHAEDEQALK